MVVFVSSGKVVDIWVSTGVNPFHLEFASVLQFLERLYRLDTKTGI